MYPMQNNGLDVIVELKGQARKIRVQQGSTYEELLSELELNPEEVLAFVNGASVPLDESVRPGTIRVLKIVTGG